MNASIETRKTDLTKVYQPLVANEVDQYLTFILNTEVFAVNILNIKEIIEFGQLTEVPRMPSFIKGVINLRGSVVPVIDLSARLGKESAKQTRKTCIVIIEVLFEGDEHVIGVMVDAVNAVLELKASEIEAAPTFGSNIRSDFIQGMGKFDQKFIIILNVNQVLSVDEMASMASLSNE